MDPSSTAVDAAFASGGAQREAVDERPRDAVSDLDPMDLLPDPTPVQVLAPDGTFTEHPDYDVDLDDGQLRELYRHMVVSRRVDREAINLQRQGQLGVYASLLGQEAAQVGGAYALGPGDWVFPSYREMGVAITRGVDPGKLLHLFRGTWLSNHDPYEHQFALYSIPIGTQALHATGFAMGARFDDNPVVTAAYFGDGATSEGDPHEAMNFAGVFKAPVVFFVQNNQWAISVPLESQTAAPSLAHKAVGYGFPGVTCDGNDVLATWAVTKRAVERARAGGGPTLVEALTYRREAHTTSDDPSRYRTREEEEEAEEGDPVARYRAFLRSRDLFDEDFSEQVEAEARDEATRMRAEIYEAPHGDPLELFEHVFVDSTGFYEGQRDLLRAELEANGVVSGDQDGADS